MKLRVLPLAGLILVLASTNVTAQIVSESVDLSVVQKIKDEGMTRSKLDDLASYLTDVIGARLTNSPASRKANEWAAETFRSWGLANVKVEPWDSAFGRGWEIVSYSGRILEPWPKPLLAYPQAWSGSTLIKGKPGTVTCQAVVLDIKDSTDIAKYVGKLRGACVLRGAARITPPEFTPRDTRLTLEALINPPPWKLGGLGGGGLISASTPSPISCSTPSNRRWSCPLRAGATGCTSTAATSMAAPRATASTIPFRSSSWRRSSTARSTGWRSAGYPSSSRSTW